jgi:pimeloyl-ACP methyl ester carboxylesterase
MQHPNLPAAVSGERFEFDSPAGRVSAYVAGNGPPLLLVHSVNAAASAAEVRPLHEHFRSTHTVFSLDLPGFGFSERSDRRYTPRLMTDAVLAMLAPIRQRCGEVPVDALAVSLGCEFLARAATESPAAWRRVALVSPTGLNGTMPRRGTPGASRAVPGLLPALRGPGWGAALFRGLTRPGVIRYFLERTWGGKAIDETLWAYDVLTTRQPGAEHAPLRFLAAHLFSADVLSLYEGLSMPVWMSHGVRGDFTDYRGRRWLEGRPNWSFTVYPTGALPFFEATQAFIADFATFLGQAQANRS